MGLESGFILNLLGSFWSKFEDRDALLSYWDALMRASSQLQSDWSQIDNAKSISTVPILFRTKDMPIVLDESTQTNPDAEGEFPIFTLPATTGSIVETLAALKTGVEGDVSMVQGVDYDVSGILISFLQNPTGEYFVSPMMNENRDLIWRNFGFPIGIRRQNSLAYRKAVEAIWYALLNGPTPFNIDVAVDAIYDAPFAKGGKVTVVDTDFGEGTVTLDNGQVITIPAYTDATVSAGDIMQAFQSLTDIVTVHDLYNDPDFFPQIANLLHPAQYYHSFYVTIDVTHLNVRAAQLGAETDLSEAAQIVDRIHPEYTNFAVMIEVETEEKLGLVNPVDLDLILAAHPNPHFNYVNWSTLPAFSAEVANQVSAISFSYANYLANLANFADYHLDEEAVAMVDDDITFLDEVFDMAPDVDTNRGNYVNFFNQPGLVYESENNLTYDEYVDLAS